ncbi:hypothetical protein E3E12_02440 [Formicincola oecophyllae]|uniref:Uncharacterized protein n=1 Tax=Formicincola oecophyllae TaxID=2558361 RepID=A0A4Y6U9Y7_9PROT|nr:hypothetical protein [Formicincola oecophyllae]QDH13247.1 hypothetical protein E3E12_02440 [Formicincola oecophyllae]
MSVSAATALVTAFMLLGPGGQSVNKQTQSSPTLQTFPFYPDLTSCNSVRDAENSRLNFRWNLLPSLHGEQYWTCRQVQIPQGFLDQELGVRHSIPTTP